MPSLSILNLEGLRKVICEMSFSSNPELSEPEKLKQYKISTDLESYENKSLKAEISGLCSGYQYNVCLQLVKDEKLKTEPFCQVRQKHNLVHTFLSEENFAFLLYGKFFCIALANFDTTSRQAGMYLMSKS